MPALLGTAFFYRLFGLKANYSFWTDENHVAIFVRAILKRGKPVLENGYSTGWYQWLQYWLGAFSAKIFGLNEFAIRFPSVIFGVLTIWAIYLLGRELFDKKTGLLAAFLTTFLKIEILWSREARPYQALQFFTLLSAYFVYKLSVSPQKSSTRRPRGVFYLLGFLVSGILATLFHGLGLVIFFNGIAFLLVTNFSRFKKYLLASLPVFLGALFLFRRLILASFSQIGRVNNLFYYRIFLTDNYLLLSILAGLGGLFLLIEAIRHSELNSESIPKQVRDDTGQLRRLSQIHFGNGKRLLLFIIFFASQSFIISFLLGQPSIRYFYAVFPFIILLASFGLLNIANQLNKLFKLQTSNFKWLVPLAMIINFVFLSRHKLVFFPQKIYSINEDMQEIPEVDWKKIYRFVAEILNKNKEAVLVANWSDLPIWYLGEGRLDYLIRKDSRELDLISSAKYINSLERFKGLVEGNRKGIFVLDSWDNIVPEGVREYCRDNLKKELEVDRLYDEQPRYWPVSVYSWGI